MKYGLGLDHDALDNEMIDLDDISGYKRLDPSGLNRRLHGLPAQCDQAWREAKKTDIPDGWRQCTEVIVAGWADLPSLEIWPLT